MLDVFCHFLLSFLRQGPLLNVELAYWLDWLVSKPAVFPVSECQCCDYKVYAAMPWVLCECGDPQTQVLVLE